MIVSCLVLFFLKTLSTQIMRFDMFEMYSYEVYLVNRRHPNSVV